MVNAAFASLFTSRTLKFIVLGKCDIYYRCPYLLLSFYIFGANLWKSL